MERSGGRAEAGGGRFLFAELSEVDVELGVVRLGLDTEFVGAVLAEPLDVLGQVRGDLGQVLRVDLPSGYARCSTAQQELASQLAALEPVCKRIFSEKTSTRVKVRPEPAIDHGNPDGAWKALNRAERSIADVLASMHRMRVRIGDVEE